MPSATMPVTAIFCKTLRILALLMKLGLAKDMTTINAASTRSMDVFS
jgi:hypothetical protein